MISVDVISPHCHFAVTSFFLAVSSSVLSFFDILDIQAIFIFFTLQNRAEKHLRNSTWWTKGLAALFSFTYVFLSHWKNCASNTNNMTQGWSHRVCKWTGGKKKKWQQHYKWLWKRNEFLFFSWPPRSQDWFSAVGDSHETYFHIGECRCRRLLEQCVCCWDIHHADKPGANTAIIRLLVCCG